MRVTQVIYKLLLKRIKLTMYVKQILLLIAVLYSNLGFATDSLLIKKTGSVFCQNYFKISARLELDSVIRNEMQVFLYQSLVDAIDCKIDIDKRSKLFSAESFRKIVLMLFTDPSYEQLSHFENPTRWREMYNNLLRNCTNKHTLYILTDNLLKRNMSNGLIVLWDSVKLQKLSSFKKYKERMVKSNNKFKCAELAVIFHNTGNARDRDLLVDSIEKQDSIIASKLKSLFDHKLVTHEEYILGVFGGY